MKARSLSNVGSYDTGARFVIGCGLLNCANHGYSWGLAGFALIASCAGFCPLYWLLGISTKECARGAGPVVRRPAVVRRADRAASDRHGEPDRRTRRLSRESRRAPGARDGFGVDLSP